MRPLKLKLQGLRSYREEQEVDFEDKRLVAIVGDAAMHPAELIEPYGGIDPRITSPTPVSR